MLLRTAPLGSFLDLYIDTDLHLLQFLPYSRFGEPLFFSQNLISDFFRRQ